MVVENISFPFLFSWNFWTTSCFHFVYLVFITLLFLLIPWGKETLYRSFTSRVFFGGGVPFEEADLSRYSVDFTVLAQTPNFVGFITLFSLNLVLGCFLTPYLSYCHVITFYQVIYDWIKNIWTYIRHYCKLIEYLSKQCSGPVEIRHMWILVLGQPLTVCSPLVSCI